MTGPDATQDANQANQVNQGSNGQRSDDHSSNGAVITAPRPKPATPTKSAPPTSRWKRSTKIALAVIAVVSLLEAAAFAGTYFLDTSKFVSTSNAQVDGDKVDINAPATGSLMDWTVTNGTLVHKNQILGWIRGVGGGGQAQHSIKSPGNGTVAINNAVEGEVVSAGTELATAYNFNDIYVTARIADTDIRDVHVGKQVDISVDASPNTPVTGIVQEIQNSAAGQFTIYPSPDTTPSNPQKVDQYVPVKIEFTYSGNTPLYPGQNVTVHIHKN
jgi:multidrug resistance efflux pump